MIKEKKHEIILPKGLRGKSYQEGLKKFAEGMIELDNQMKHKVSARGWCYLLEGMNLITKDQFNYCEKIINKCRKRGYIPINFTAIDKKREFINVERLTAYTVNPINYINGYLKLIRNIHENKNDVAFWESQEYYIQMAVEKVDILTLFKPICKKYHIPIANMVGWSDMNSRAELVRRFKEAEEQLGLKPILLYYGDYDPAGILIADFLKKNLDALKFATLWNTENLIVERFGLTIDFINENNLTWIDNLITSGKRNLGMLYSKHIKGEKDKKGRNLLFSYEIEYIEKNGVRKCEANAILPIADIAEAFCEAKILEYLGDNCFIKYDEKIKEIQDETKAIMDNVNYQERIDNLMVELNELKFI